MPGFFMPIRTIVAQGNILRCKMKLLRLVDDLFHGSLGLADGLLCFADTLLNDALGMKAIIADCLAGSLLHIACSFVGEALDLV